MDEEISKKFEEIERRIAILESENNSIPAVQNREKKKSVKEFILEKSPQDGVQSATSIAYYLENFENKKILTSKEIERCFRDAKLQTPPNVPDKIQKSIANGWMAKGEKRGEFYLTATGEKLIEKGFNKNGKSK